MTTRTPTEVLIRMALDEHAPNVSPWRLRDRSTRSLPMRRIRCMVAVTLFEDGLTHAQIGDVIGVVDRGAVARAIADGRRYREGWRGPRTNRRRYRPKKAGPDAPQAGAEGHSPSGRLG